MIFFLTGFISDIKAKKSFITDEYTGFPVGIKTYKVWSKEIASNIGEKR